MKVTLKTTLATLLAIVAPVLLWSQSKPMPINVSLFNESTAIPFTRFITTPVHPGIQVGTEFDYTSKAHTRLFQTLNASYFYHNYLAQGVGHNVVLSIMEDKKGNLWLGTFAGGVSCYDGQSFTTFNTAQGLADNYVLSILEDKKGIEVPGAGAG